MIAFLEYLFFCSTISLCLCLVELRVLFSQVLMLRFWVLAFMCRGFLVRVCLRGRIIIKGNGG